MIWDWNKHRPASQAATTCGHRIAEDLIKLIRQADGYVHKHRNATFGPSEWRTAAAAEWESARRRLEAALRALCPSREEALRALRREIERRESIDGLYQISAEIREARQRGELLSGDARELQDRIDERLGVRPA